MGVFAIALPIVASAAGSMIKGAMDKKSPQAPVGQAPQTIQQSVFSRPPAGSSLTPIIKMEVPADKAEAVAKLLDQQG